jgi:hypothetical protein
MVSSGMGSFTVANDPRWFGLVPPQLGYTAADLTGHAGFQTVTEETDAIVQLATAGPDGPTGGFFNREGTVPW